MPPRGSTAPKEATLKTAMSLGPVIDPPLVMPPSNCEVAKTPMPTKLFATSLPAFVIPPAIMPSKRTSIPAPRPLIKPPLALTIPPEKFVTLSIAIASLKEAPQEMVPLLAFVIPPLKFATLSIRIAVLRAAILPLLVMPPVKVESANKLVPVEEKRVPTKMPVPPEIRPLLVMPPAKVDITTDTPFWLSRPPAQMAAPVPAEIVPPLRIPPANVSSVTDTPVGGMKPPLAMPPTKMPGAPPLTTSRPLLTITPVKADSVTDAPDCPVAMPPTKMPGSRPFLPAEMVPVLTIPPPKVSRVTAPAAAASPPTKMPVCPAAMTPALLMLPVKVPSVLDPPELL
jgi:hypothetical protein